MTCHNEKALIVLRFFFGLALIAAMSIPSFAGENVTLYDSSGKVLEPSQIDRVSISKSCGDCHDDVIGELSASVHGRADRSPGDHPNCITCHGASPHPTRPIAGMSRRWKAARCSGCHSNAQRMKPYGETPEAVSSYQRSYHGRYLLRFHKNNSAQCTDCHGYHGVLASSDPAAMTSPHNLDKTCATCHKGARRGFSTSGAGHLNLAIERSPILRWEDIFFKLLTAGTMAGLLGMIALDLRRKVFDPRHAPRSGRLVAFLEALAFCWMVAGMVMAVGRIRGAEWAWIAAVGLMAAAFLVYLVRVKPRKPAVKERRRERFTASVRAQHICLIVSFTVLALTGMPLKFAHVDWSHSFQAIFGGLDGARIAHRVAAVILTITWVWHFFFLLYRWKKHSFSLKSWTMMPTWKDFTDFFDTVKYNLGIRAEPPQFGRFDFRQKFDYFAVYWGMPIMALSGFILWFPVCLGARLPAISYAISYIAHSDEALLALLAILMWHLYNAHFDPDHFPVNWVWYSGVLTESEMAEMHPLEKGPIDPGGARP